MSKEPHKEPVDPRRNDQPRNEQRDAREMEELHKEHDFIERTRPDDPSERFGQITRDNVNPNIPSAPPKQVREIESLQTPQSINEPPGARIIPPNEGGIAPPPTPTREEQLEQRQQPQESEGAPGMQPVSPRVESINEPPGSNVLPGEGGPNQIPDGAQLPPLVLSDIDPDSIVIGSAQDFVLTVTGSGFGPNCLLVVDDEEYETTGDQTTLTASLPVATEAGVVDVEVHRGEEMSDVLTFEFVAPAGRRSTEKAERKAKKTEPRHKRTKKRRAR